MSKTRKATHAGSWYSQSSEYLSKQLDDWLSKAIRTQCPARAIIAPHAGYFYSGACSAYAYKQIDPSNVLQIATGYRRICNMHKLQTDLLSQLLRRVFILGPSHKVRLEGCALSAMDKYETPLYDLPIDQAVYAELYATKLFETMKVDVDEDEHSIEMHLPYIAKVMESQGSNFSIIPVLVGSLSPENEQIYGKVFSQYLSDPQNVFVISSDFCHWGQRFKYRYYDKNLGEIWNSIKNLDEMGMEIIESLESAKFNLYLREYQNTICGRHPISVLINAANSLKKNGKSHEMTLKFLQYAQSNQVRSMDDSSVSYASAALVIS